MSAPTCRACCGTTPPRWWRCSVSTTTRRWSPPPLTATSALETCEASGTRECCTGHRITRRCRCGRGVSGVLGLCHALLRLRLRLQLVCVVLRLDVVVVADLLLRSSRPAAAGVGQRAALRGAVRRGQLHAGADQVPLRLPRPAHRQRAGRAVPRLQAAVCSRLQRPLPVALRCREALVAIHAAAIVVSTSMHRLRLLLLSVHWPTDSGVKKDALH